MTVAENLLLARATCPRSSTGRRARAELARLPGDRALPADARRHAADLAAGEKQKLEILKQLYLKPRLLILDEPTSVLTPQEADEVLGPMRRPCAGRAADGADDHAQVPRGDRLLPTTSPCCAAAGARARRAWPTPRRGELAGWMMGAAPRPSLHQRRRHAGPWHAAQQRGGLPRCWRARAAVSAAQGRAALASAQGGRSRPLGRRRLTLNVMPGEIVGVAGVSGNGQRELVEALTGQRCRSPAARSRVDGQPYRATRAEPRA